MKSLFSKKGQNLTEIALIIGIVGLVLIGMEVYARRGIQGKIKALTDSMIGTKQATYQQDTSGLAINTSDSEFVSSSQSTSSERSGGQKVVTSTEQSTVSYTYASQDSLGK